jgi:hypothetical protein
LIVDDEPRNLTVLEAIPDGPGYKLVRAGTAEQALLADEFALLILDIQFSPDKRGNFLKAVKRFALIMLDGAPLYGVATNEGTAKLFWLTYHHPDGPGEPVPHIRFRLIGRVIELDAVVRNDLG